VVAVGESFTLPEACELVVTVRPSDVVILTEVEFEACQLKVTLWPDVIVPVLAEKVMVGAGGGGGGGGLDMLLHAESAKHASTAMPEPIRRKPFLFIAVVASVPVYIISIASLDAAPLAGVAARIGPNAG
jgi:hypothetical protein